MNDEKFVNVLFSAPCNDGNRSSQTRCFPVPLRLSHGLASSPFADGAPSPARAASTFLFRPGRGLREWFPQATALRSGGCHGLPTPGCPGPLSVIVPTGSLGLGGVGGGGQQPETGRGKPPIWEEPQGPRNPGSGGRPDRCARTWPRGSGPPQRWPCGFPRGRGHGCAARGAPRAHAPPFRGPDVRGLPWEPRPPATQRRGGGDTASTRRRRRCLQAPGRPSPCYLLLVLFLCSTYTYFFIFSRSLFLCVCSIRG